MHERRSRCAENEEWNRCTEKLIYLAAVALLNYHPWFLLPFLSSDKLITPHCPFLDSLDLLEVAPSAFFACYY